MRYFAYGSNLCSARLSGRVPRHLPEGVGTLRGYVLRFDKMGRDGSAKCNIARTNNPTDFVLGVIYRLTAAGGLALDRIEGLGRGYNRRTVSIAAQGRRARAFTYVACPGATAQGLKPFDWYLAYVLAGAKRHGFPSSYIQALLSVRCTADPNTARGVENRRILSGPNRVGVTPATKV